MSSDVPGEAAVRAVALRLVAFGLLAGGRFWGWGTSPWTGPWGGLLRGTWRRPAGNMLLVDSSRFGRVGRAGRLVCASGDTAGHCRVRDSHDEYRRAVPAFHGAGRTVGDVCPGGPAVLLENSLRLEPPTGGLIVLCGNSLTLACGMWPGTVLVTNKSNVEYRPPLERSFCGEVKRASGGLEPILALAGRPIAGAGAVMGPVPTGRCRPPGGAPQRLASARVMWLTRAWAKQPQNSGTD